MSPSGKSYHCRTRAYGGTCQGLTVTRRIIEEDVKKSAAIIASAVYHLAMRDEMLPRFSKEEMPAPPAPPGGGRGGGN